MVSFSFNTYFSLFILKTEDGYLKAHDVNLQYLFSFYKHFSFRTLKNSDKMKTRNR
jgi:hypothetical protein